MSGYKVDVNTENFETITLFGQPMLFTCLRCDRNTLPKGMYMYEIRHDDDGMGEPCEIADWILVNLWGTVISNRPVTLDEKTPTGKPYRLIDSEKDWDYIDSDITLKEYMEKHPPKKERIQER